MPFLIFSQENPSTGETKVERLEEIFIERNDVLNVKGGEKRKPSVLPTLTKSDLDSLNSLEKQQSLLLPTAGLPTQIIPNAKDRAFVRGEFGRFSTLDAEAGYAFSWRDFDIYSIADLEMSSGHLDNAGYFNGGFRFISDYVAPKKFWIFGGSKTRTRFDWNRAAFNNFSVNNPEERSIDSLALMMDVEGDYNGFQFLTGAGFDLYNLSADTADFTDTGLKGYLRIINPYKNWRFSAGGNAELRGGNEQSNNYVEADGKIAFLSKNIDFYGKGGVQVAQNENEGIFRPNFEIGVNIKSNNNITFSANSGSRLIRNTFANFTRFNPYIAWNTFLDHTAEDLFVDANFSYHPLSRFRINLSGKYALLNNTVNWVSQDSSQFNIYYDNANQLKFNLETYFDFNENNTVSLIIENNNITTDSLSNQQTYLPTLNASLNYYSLLFDKLAVDLSLSYIGTRFADIDNKVELDPFINLDFETSYKLFDNITLIVSGENLLNQDIYQFNFYRQRGLFFSLGVLWKI
jgi:hypothetical protein